MKAARLNLDYERGFSRASRLGWTLLACGATAAAFAGYGLVETRRDTQALENALASVQVTRRDVPRSAVAPEELRRIQQEMKFAEGVAEQLTLPWEALFRALESAAINDVVLLSLEPEAKRRTLRITAEARNKDRMLAYFKRLSGNNMLLDVHIVDHQVQSEPGQPVRFSIKASWAGGAT